MDDALSVLASIKECIKEVSAWMSSSKLKLNEDKTEFLIITTPHFKKTFHDISLEVGGLQIQCAEKARNLGVFFDSVMDMKCNVTAICKSAYYHLRNIGSVRKYLTSDSAAQIIHAFVTSRLDYCNSLLAGIPASSVARLQKIQNTAARIITLSRKLDHITPVLVQLHWLPVPLRIQFKILLITFKIRLGSAPSYLSDLVSDYKPGRTLRSASKMLLTVPKSNLQTYGDRAFSIYAPKLWNDLPKDIKRSETLDCFKRQVKTFLFKKFIADPPIYIKK